jgi:hypothetical protein
MNTLAGQIARFQNSRQTLLKSQNDRKEAAVTGCDLDGWWGGFIRENIQIVLSAAGCVTAV